MHMLSKKQYLLAFLTIVSVGQSASASTSATASVSEEEKKTSYEVFQSIGKKPLELQDLFFNFVFHAAVARWVKEFSSKFKLNQYGWNRLNAHDALQWVRLIAIELIRSKLMDEDKDLKIQKIVELCTYGMLSGKVLEEVAVRTIDSFELEEYFTEEDKENYGMWGSSWIKGTLGTICYNLIHGTSTTV